MTDYKSRFEHYWGDAMTWEEFCALVQQEVKPGAIQTKFRNRAGKPMSRQTFWRWKHRV